MKKILALFLISVITTVLIYPAAAETVAKFNANECLANIKTSLTAAYKTELDKSKSVSDEFLKNKFSNEKNKCSNFALALLSMTPQTIDIGDVEFDVKEGAFTSGTGIFFALMISDINYAVPAKNGGWPIYRKDEINKAKVSKKCATFVEDALQDFNLGYINTPLNIVAERIFKKKLYVLDAGYFSAMRLNSKPRIFSNLILQMDLTLGTIVDSFNFVGDANFKKVKTLADDFYAELLNYGTCNGLYMYIVVLDKRYLPGIKSDGEVDRIMIVDKVGEL